LAPGWVKVSEYVVPLRGKEGSQLYTGETILPELTRAVTPS